MPDPSMPQPMPGQGDCPPGYRPSKPYPGMPTGPGQTSCEPVGGAVPAGGWREAAPGYGPGYPPTGGSAIEALRSVPWAAAEQLAGAPGEASQAVGGYVGGYADWLRAMAGW
jgi:hypothetical protein